MILAKAYPHLKFCIQDRPKTVELGTTVKQSPSPCAHLLIKPTKVWKKQCPEILESGRAVFQGWHFFFCGARSTYPHRTAHDFFTPQPVQDAAVFLLRAIVHDWPDDFVTRILLQLRHAATPQTKLVIADHILPLACEDDTDGIGAVRTLAPPSSGLLPNLGKASANVYWIDMIASRFFLPARRRY
jgi:hypothetical protein